jgi:hypothetical protein
LAGKVAQRLPMCPLRTVYGFTLLKVAPNGHREKQKNGRRRS